MQKVLVTIKIMIKNVMKKEPVLSIAVILAVISMFVVHPDDTYASYIDFRGTPECAVETLQPTTVNLKSSYPATIRENTGK